MTAPPYPLASAPGVHVFLVTGLDNVTTCVYATASQHKAAAKWAEMFEAGHVLEVQAWHDGGRWRSAVAGWFGGTRTWSVTP